ncbi:MAG: sugar phosphate isomerase/epimerase, partial [Actinomycetota bacterium]|nr:sugar phosphate isomerase/epimerase [Actinomycetota bacterium]
MADRIVALQMYTVRELAGKDMLGTLVQVAGMGYRAIELAGYAGVAPGRLRSALDEAGLRAIASHVPLGRWVERADQVLDELQTIGCSYAVTPSPPDDVRMDERGASEIATMLNGCGERCRAAGLRFAYHNHAGEFAPAGKGSCWEAMVERTDPELVEFELDLYWAEYAGVDAAELLDRHPGRVPLVHVKDMAPGPGREDRPVGEGTLQWDSLLQAAERAGTTGYIVEQDDAADPLRDSATSLKNLERML